MKKLGVIIIQVLFLHVFLFLGIALKQILPLPIPGSMFGLLLLFLALNFNIVKIEWVEQGAGWLLAELLLFFVPSAVGIVNYQEIISVQGLGIVLLITISTIIVMGITGITADKIAVWKKSDLK